MITIHANIPVINPPTWAVLERSLIALMNESIDPLMEKYVRQDGSLLWPAQPDYSSVDALDDAYESFHNWPLFYMLGGSKKFLDLSHRAFDAITKQFSQYDCGHGHPMVYKEYEQGYDWFHQGEGYLFFYLLGLADPHNSANKERAIRFAGFYLNEDPEAPNYDADRNIVKCAHSGSKGPAFRNFTGAAWVYEEWKSFYGLPFMDVEGCNTIEDIKNPLHAATMGQVMKERMSRGDVAVNLSITTMVTHAYLYTGEQKYKDWVLNYVDGWMQRTEANKGILPDNVGLNGEVGQYMDGKWYGGYYGWTWPHGWLSIGDSLVIAGENSLLLSKDQKYLDLPRSQIDVLIGAGKMKENTLRVPYKYGDPGSYDYQLWIEGVLLNDQDAILWDNGWFEFQPLDAKYMAHIWQMSMASEDMDRIHKVRNNLKNDSQQIVPNPHKKDQSGQDAGWLAYLQGDFPAYPEETLKHNMSQVYQRLDFIRNDKQDPATYTDSYLQRRNTITMEGLVHLTMGASLPMYNGGLLMGRVSYYDVQCDRPGLPEDVAALVEKLEDNYMVVHLVNLSPVHQRELRIQAGAFGEHQFKQISYQARHEEQVIETTVDVNNSQFQVQLEPGCSIILHMAMERFVNDPSYFSPITQ